MFYGGAPYGSMHYGGFPIFTVNIVFAPTVDTPPVNPGILIYNLEYLDFQARTITYPAWGYTDDWSLAAGDPEVSGVCIDGLQYTDIDLDINKLGYHRDGGMTLEFESPITLVQEFHSRLPWE